LNEYLKLVDEAQKKRLKLTNDQIYQIKNMYNDISRDLIARARAEPKGSMTERWLRDFRRQFRTDISKLNDILEKNITGSMEQSAGYAAAIQSEMFDLISSKIDISNSFSNMFTKVPTEVVAELVNGDFYKDGKGLSKRIWHNENKANGEFDYILEKGLAEKRSIADIAADLAKYVNPNVKNDWDFKKIYPGVGNKKIEYNSLRLAVTSISHAYQLSLQRSCKANPFVEGIQWHTGNSHRNMCELCKNRNGVVYDADKLPLDHPMGVCYFTPVIEKSLDDIGTELRNWVNGGSNAKLNQYFPDVAIDKPQPTPLDPKKEPKKEEPISFTKMQEVFKAKRLGKIWPGIESKINGSPEFMQKWYNKFQDKLQFDKTSDPKYAYYSPSTKGLTMHVKRDAAETNSRGANSIFFHEFGHLLDDAARKLAKVNEKWVLGDKPSEDPRFISAIKEDYQDRLNMPLFKDKPQPFVEGKLTDLLRAEGDHSSGVQDMYSGLTLNRVRPGWGHDTKYWLRDNTELEIASEAFAHMSSGFTNPERLKIMKEWFPKSCDAFETIINELLD
jgi:hypothetical protein